MPRSLAASLITAALLATFLTGCVSLRDGLESGRADPLDTPSEDSSSTPTPTAVEAVPVDTSDLNERCPKAVMQRYVDNGLFPLDDTALVEGEAINTVLSSAGFDCVVTIFSTDDLERYGRAEYGAEDVVAFVLDPTEARSAQVVGALESAGFVSVSDNAWQLDGSQLGTIFTTRESYGTEPSMFKIDDLGHDYSVSFFFERE